MRDYDSLFTQLLSDLGATETTGLQCRTDSSVEAVAKYQLATSFYKKLCPTGTQSVEADNLALEKFLALNSAIPEGPFDFAPANEAESCFWDYFLNEVELSTYSVSSGRSFDLEFIRDHMGVGPGSAQKADSTSAITKLFKSPLSYYNPDLIRVYRGALANAGVWAEAEMQRFQQYGFTKVEGVKIFFAPKNREISRTCGTEAGLGMLIQKAVGAYLEQGLEERFGISLSTQPDLNRYLAGKGSDDHESSDSFCTVDLTSASDCIRLALVQRCIRNPVLKGAMMCSRAEFAVFPDGKRVELRMCSTMGNGFTFPLQTLLFASAVRAVYTLMGIPLVKDKAPNFAVFGDDIVVRKPAYDFLLRMLEKLGFLPNKEKSFCTGPFRESCGHDYFKGSNVRGVYIRSLETDPEVVSAINRLNRWSALHGVCLPKTLSYLYSLVPRFNVVPPSEADDAGVQVPFQLTRPRLTNTYWFKYRAFRKVGRRVDVEEPHADNPGHDDLGFACGILSGYYRRRDVELKVSENQELIDGFRCWADPSTDWSVSVTLRDELGARPRYKVITNSIPYWDFVRGPQNLIFPARDGPCSLSPTGESYSRWVSAVAMTFPR